MKFRVEENNLQLKNRCQQREASAREFAEHLDILSLQSDQLRKPKARLPALAEGYPCFMISEIPIESVLYLKNLDIERRRIFFGGIHINPIPRVRFLSRRFNDNVVVNEPEDKTMKAPEIAILSTYLWSRFVEVSLVPTSKHQHQWFILNV